MAGRMKKILIVLLILAFSVTFYALSRKFLVRELAIIHPLEATLFPLDIASPLFRWADTKTPSEYFSLRFEFEATEKPLEFITNTVEWSPNRNDWETMKKQSLEKPATLTITGFKNILGVRIAVSKKSLTFTTSMDKVDAPVLFRAVPLPFEHAVQYMDSIMWCFGDISSEKPPRIVLKNMKMCANCHSFSTDGKILGMDVDYANDKGSYVITEVAEEVILDKEKIITWSDYKREDRELTFGLLSQMSPSGKYSISTVKDRSVFVPMPDLYYSQLFFPIKGILAYYNTQTGSFHELPGADDKEFVQSNPAWSPDGKYIVFAKNKADSLKHVGNHIILNPDQCSKYTKDGEPFKFSLYRIPFNDGKGGRPTPIECASDNGMSNYFPKYSPDGKWIVFCKANSYMLLQPDSRLYIMPAEGGEAREMTCNTNQMNSWHSWSPNGKWLVFSSKVYSPYTQLFLTHIDENGNSTPPVFLSHFVIPKRAANIPEFVNSTPGGIVQIQESFLDYYSFVRQAEDFMAFEKYADAEKLLKKSIELNPNFVRAHHQLGILMNKMHRIADAERELKFALELDPENPEVFYNLGQVYMDKQDHERAQDAFQKSISLDPSHAYAYESLGLLLLLKNKPEEAQVQLRKAVDLDPDLDVAHYNLGVIHLFKNEHSEARKEFEAVLKINPHNLSALHNLGVVYMNAGEYNKAESAFRTICLNKPNDYAACMMLGIALSKSTNSISEAISMYKKAQSIDPLNAQAYIELGSLYLQNGNRAQALMEYETALRLNPNLHDLKSLIERLKSEE